MRQPAPLPLQLTREDGHRDEVGQEAAPAAASARRRHLGGEVEVTAGGGRVSGPRGPAGDTFIGGLGQLLGPVCCPPRPAEGEAPLLLGEPGGRDDQPGAGAGALQRQGLAWTE